MIRVATVFSGIGAFEYALKKNNIEHTILFACDCGDRKVELSEDQIKHLKSIKDDLVRNNEVDKIYNKSRKENRVKDTYIANYRIENDCWFNDIRFVNGKPFKNKVDIFVGGSPCQSFSLMGKRKGLKDVRGTLFYEYARLIKEIEPKVFIFENVPGMYSHDGGKTWDTIKNIFYSLGYDIHYDILNACDYGIPQSRQRLFVVGFKGKQIRTFEFPKKQELHCKAEDFLEEHIDPKYYFKKKGFEFVTNPKYSGRAKINSDIIRTEKRNQQFNWNGDFRFEPLASIKDKIVLQDSYIGKYKGVKGVARKLTPRECHRLMGFGDDFVINPNDIDAYKQAGNSIVVNVMEAIVKEIIKIEKL